MKDDRGDLDLTKQIEVLTQKVHDAELETSLVKAVGMNSPEMRALKKEVEEVKQDNIKLALQVADQKDISKGHQQQFGKLQVELTESKKRECKCNTKTSTSS